MANHTINCTASSQTNLYLNPMDILYPYQEILAQMQNPATVIPTTQPITVTFRGPASSADYTNFTRSIYRDVVQLYQVQQGVLADTGLINEGAVEKYNGLVQKLEAIEDRLDGLSNLYSGLYNIYNPDPRNPKQDTITLTQSLYDAQVIYGGFPSYYPSSAPLPANQRAVYVPRYSQLVPSYAQAPLSKTYLVDPVSGNIVNPPDVLEVQAVNTSPSHDPFDLEENDIGYAVDGSELDFYRRNMYFTPNDKIDYVDVNYKLTIPQQFVNDLRCNYVTLHPYAEFQQHLMSVKVHNSSNNSNLQLMPTDNFGNIQPFPNASKHRFIFPDFQTDTLNVRLRQTVANSSIRPGMQTFTSGIALLDIGYIVFNQNVSRALIPFSLNNNSFKSITDVEPTIPGITYNIWYDTGAGDIAQTDLYSTIPGTCKNVYVEAVFTPSLGVMPVLDKVLLTFVPLNGI